MGVRPDATSRFLVVTGPGGEYHIHLTALRVGALIVARRRRPHAIVPTSKGVRQLEEMKHDLIGVVGQDHVVDDPTALRKYARDESFAPR